MEEHAASFDWHSLLSEPKVWIAVAFITFFAMFGKKLVGAMLRGLDARSETIARDLEEARRLREEANAVLNAYRTKHAESIKEAEEILHRARMDAERMVATAQAELKQLLDTRTRMAEAKISQAEKQAVDDVRGHVIDITISAAKALIMENIQAMPGDELIRRAIADIERKVH